MTRSWALAASAAFLMAFGFTYPALADAANGMPDDAEITKLFSEFCIQSFPDQTAVDNLAVVERAVPMSAEDVKGYLQDTPGRGWHLQTPDALFAITIEAPPSNACAVRRMTPVGVSDVKNYIAAVKAYAAGKNAKLESMPPQHDKSSDGVDTSLYAYGIMDAGNEPTEIFAVVLTNYHQRPPERYRADASTGAGVEVRMVHQIATP